ncbi:choice-of-anchor G family protein [Microbacterium sp. CGR1]|uniref:choice-of-anchor G family protein n=1 Tax=Microbacterium sp. CGR1 TaxID=1696072 RepID=UPI00069E3CF3|nr:choice-of-anchor G family protein [Microbacterium sp. CGR1]
MEFLEGKTLRRRRAIGGGIAGVTVGAMILAGALVPTAANALDDANPNDPSVAQGQIIQLPADLLGGLDVAALGHTLTSNPAAVGPELGGLDLDVLEALSIDVGTLNVPLLTDGTSPGLLQLGDLGGAQSFSSSPTQTQSIASSGAITSGGAIDAGAIDGSVNPATLELTDLFDQLSVAGLTDAVLDEASVGIGALASRAESNAGVAGSEYRIAGLDLDLHSNLVAGLATTLGTAIQGTVTPVSDLAGPGGALTGLVTTVVNTINAIPDVPLVAAFEATGGTVAIAGLDTVGATVVTELLTEPLENTTGSVLVDLSDGTISVDLAQILVETGAGADLNSLPANTPVLSATTIAAIQQGITSALTGTHPNSLNGKVATILGSTLDSLAVTLTVGVDLTNPLTGIDLVSGDVTIAGSLAQFAGTATPVPTVTTDISLAGLNIGALLNPVVSAVTTAVTTTTGPLVNTALTSVIPLVQPALAAVTGPVLSTLDPVLQGVLSGIATITINEQSEPGDIPGDSFTVRALAIDLLPAVGGGVELDLASSTVKAAAAAVAAIDAATTVQAGTDLPVTGSGWPANTQVTIQVAAPDGTPVNESAPVTTDASGNFTGTVFIPASTVPGTGYIVTATDGTSTATDTTEVTAAAAIDAAPAVQDGTDLGVSGTNWPANTQISVQLTAPGGGANIGGPELVTTDGSGAFVLGYPVPAGTPAGTGYTVTATLGAQTATDTTEVTNAPVASIDAAPTVQAGTDLAVSGSNWPANTEISVQLTAPGGGADVGGPETVTTNGDGEFTLSYPVPASATPGTAYTVTATAGAETAIDTTEVTAAAAVDAADTVQAGTSLPIAGANWPANTVVEVQLTDPDGADVGGPETVTTDGDGGFTLNYPVPASATPGTGYTVTATVGGQTAEDTTEVTAAAAVDAADTVQAGTSLPVTGTGWPANTEVSVQLTAPGGATVGGPETVTTDGDGGFTLDYPVPASATPGTGYTITATVGTQTATDTTEVTAAATVDAAATVEAGADLTITGAEWPADTEVTVQLTAPGGAVIGTPQTVTTGALGGFAIDYPVPAGTPAGTGYTVTASAGTQTATDTTEVTAAPVVVDAASSVPAGTNLAVTGTGWPVNSTVSLQLTAPGGGADIGGPVIATTDEFGAFTENYPVPADAEPGAGYLLTATSGASSDTDTTEVTAGDPGDVNTNAAASASASADATADGDPSAQAAAEAAALADATSAASAAATSDATSAADAAATPDASSAATTDVTSTANASAAVAAQAAAQADASDDVNADASTAAESNSASSSESAAIADSSTDASSEAAANTNAAASASASANADASTDAIAEAAAQAAAFADATAEGSAAADPTAEAAAESAATATSSTAATADATSEANAGAAVAAQAAALADATTDTAAEASATSDASTSAASNSSAAAIASASTDASSDAVATADASAAADPSAEVDTNASASAAASAQADDDSNAAAQAAAVAAALADATSSASAAADVTADAAASAAATDDASTDASATATTDADASAAAAAQAAAQNDATSTSAADASAAADADPNASAAAAANASSSATASATAAADASAEAEVEASAATTADAAATADASAAADPSAEVDTNASASAAASAQADDDSNAAAQAAAVAAALADATSSASAAADVTADAAASAAATDDASTDASATATTDANASAASAAAAQASAQNDATSTSAADASASADADPNASAAAAANASSSATASASAAADASAEAAAEASASATAEASASADAAADPTGPIAITIKVPVLERGEKQTAVGTGFQPGESVTGVMTSEPIALGTQVADAQGTVTFTWTIPSGTDLGTHAVTLTGATSGSVSASFQVVATGLATTGGEIQGGWIALAALLLMLGLGMTRVARSRRPLVQTE